MFCNLLMLAVHLQWKLNPGHQVLGPDVLADCATWSPNGSKLRAQKSNLNLTNQKSYFSAYFMVSLIGQSQRTRQNFFTSSKPAYLNSQGSLKLSHVPSNMLWAVSVNIIPRGTKFPILSDSQSVHLAISSSSKTIPIIRQIQKRTFNLLRQSINIPFHWVPRHKNIHGNELADKAARTAVNYPINTTHNIKIPLSHCKPLLKEYFQTL